MKRTLIILLAVFIGAAVYADEFEGEYELSYPELMVSFDVNLDFYGLPFEFTGEFNLDEFPEHLFYDFQDILFDYIDDCPYIPEQFKEMARDFVEELIAGLMAEISPYWGDFAAWWRGWLPYNASLEQEGAFGSIVKVYLERLEFLPWMGLINLFNGDLEMMPVFLPETTIPLNFGDLTVSGAQEASGNIDRDAGYAGEGVYDWAMMVDFFNPDIAFTGNVYVDGIWECTPHQEENELIAPYPLAH